MTGSSIKSYEPEDDNTDRAPRLSDRPPGGPAHALIEEKGYRYLCVDGYWGTGVFTPPPRLKVVLWALRMLPLTLLLLGPDKRDERLLASDSDKDDLKSLAGPMARLAMRMLVVAIYLCFAIRLPTLLGVFAFAVLILALSLWIGRTKLFSDVYVAAATENELNQVVSFLEMQIEGLQETCEKVVVVGHSQGGYLSYLAVKRNKEPQSLALVGVASGLKPIWIMTLMRRSRILGSAWLLYLGELAMFILFIIGFNENHIHQVNEAIVDLLRLFMTPPGALPSIEQSSSKASDMLDELADSIMDGYFPFLITSLAALAIASGVGYFVSKQIKREIAVQEIVVPEVSGLGLWWETSSVHDPVGRMILPVLPSAVERLSWPVLSNPLLDHVAIKRREGLLARQIGYVLRSLGGQQSPALDILNARAERTFGELSRIRTFASLVLVIALWVMLMVRDVQGDRPLGIFADTPWQPALLAVLVSGALVYAASRVQKSGRAELEKEMSSSVACSPLRTMPIKGRCIFGGIALISVVPALATVIQGGQVGVWVGFACLILALGVLSGYFVRPLFPLGIVSVTILVAIVAEPLPHGPGVPTWEALPGISANVVLILLMIIVAAWLWRQRVQLRRTP